MTSSQTGPYHAKYAFKDGTFTADRRLLVKKDKVPLDQWEKYLTFRRAIYDEEVRTDPIISGSATSNNPGGFNQAAGMPFENAASILSPLHEALAILTAETPPTKVQLDKADDLADAVVSDVEARSLEIPPDDIHSLYWTQLLAYAWYMQGWTALEENAFDDAEEYLRAAWQLSQDQTSGYLLGRLLEAKGEHVEAAHVLELAYISGVEIVHGMNQDSGEKLQQQISETYKKITGKELTATPLNHGQYTGSLRAELDKGNEIRGFTKTSKLTGEGLYIVAYETGKPVKAYFLGGDPGFGRMSSILENQRFPATFPADSKARVLREVRLVCAPYGGCAAYMLLPTSIMWRSNSIPIKVINVTPPNAPPDERH